jgi:hypothetical protein
MALDAYVMPLWRFKAGDFTSPIEETLGIRPTVILLADMPPPPAPWYLRLLAKIGMIEFVPPPPEPIREERCAAAVQEVDALKAQLTEMVGTPIDWPGCDCEVIFNTDAEWGESAGRFPSDEE